MLTSNRSVYLVIRSADFWAVRVEVVDFVNTGLTAALVGSQK